MKFAAFYTPDGVVQFVTSFREDEEPIGDLPWVEVPEFVTADAGWVHDGQWAAYSAEGAARKAAHPGYPARWDPAYEEWIDLRLPADRTAAQWAAVRKERNRLLAESDWTDTFSAPARLGQTLYSSWQSYRQALRDITQQPDPFNITWPTPPA